MARVTEGAVTSHKLPLTSTIKKKKNLFVNALVAPVVLRKLYTEAVVEARSVSYKDAEFDVTYTDLVTSSNQIIYKFNRTVTSDTNEGVRLTVDVLSQDLDHPVQRSKRVSVYHIGRTLCFPPLTSASETQTFYVDVSTLSGKSTNYVLRVSRLQSFTYMRIDISRHWVQFDERVVRGAITCAMMRWFETRISGKTDQKLNFEASPSQPQYFKYVFPEGLKTVRVKVRSELKLPCAVLSVQNIQCPVYDSNQNVDFIGKYQTVTKMGAITLKRKHYPSGGVYVVVVVKVMDAACESSEIILTKPLMLQIEPRS
ncbi:hypothetical protein WMY93_000134 [Mugilogobius chulae]|uniref:Uncharacterized protein n=1 Tax=Mugilogobius chulae TaxID=88201 RepID=A0AAW0PYI7_9GOBI